MYISHLTSNKSGKSYLAQIWLKKNRATEYNKISNYELILNDKKNPKFPSITFEEIEINTKILSHWINLG